MNIRERPTFTIGEYGDGFVGFMIFTFFGHHSLDSRYVSADPFYYDTTEVYFIPAEAGNIIKSPVITEVADINPSRIFWMYILGISIQKFNFQFLVFMRRPGGSSKYR